MVTLSMRTWKRLLWTANLALAMATVCAASLLALLPLAGETSTDTTPTDSAVVLSAARQGVDAPAAYAVIYRRDLRKPLYDPKPVPVVTPEPKIPRLAVQLIGTVVEPAHTYGFFRSRSGQVKMLTVGETIDGAEVVFIRDNAATVKFHDRMIELLTRKEKQ